MTFTYRHRLGLLAVLGSCGALLVLTRLVTLQMIEHDKWYAKAYHEDGDPQVVEGPRAPILDASGAVLAEDELAFDLVLKPAAWEGRRHECSSCGKVIYYLPDPRRRLEAVKCPRCRRRGTMQFTDQRDLGPVATALGVSPAELILRIEEESRSAERRAWWQSGDASDRKWETRLSSFRRDHGWRSQVLVSDVPYEVAREVEINPRRNPAFRIETQRSRRYPGGADFVHVVGREPSTGVERRFDRELRGEERWIGPDGNLWRTAGLPGRTVQLTIAAEDQRNAMEALNGVEGAFVVVNAETGAVLAMASRPTYDPGEYKDVLLRLSGEDAPEVASPLLDRAYSGYCIPGSIVKPFTAIAALDAGVVRPEDTIVCEKYFTFRGKQLRKWLRCHDVHGAVDLHRALVKSCNIYFQTMMDRLLEGEHLDGYLATGRAFGLGVRTGIEMETDRLERKTFRFDDPPTAELLAAATGQGRMLLSPAQVARAYAGIAAGRLPRLHVVARVGDRSTAPKWDRIPIDGAVLERIRAALADVARPGGTAAGHGLQAWEIGCKTGTAQKRPEGIHNGWVAGIAPAQAGRPAIAFAMAVLNTRLGGSQACGPRLRSFFLRFYGGSSG